MPFLPSAIGYLRSDVSGARQPWDENQIRYTAARLGYDLRKIVVFSATTTEPMRRLRVVVDRLGVDAIVTPGLGHFEPDEVPTELVGSADIVTVSPECVYARVVAPAQTSARSAE